MQRTPRPSAVPFPSRSVRPWSLGPGALPGILVLVVGLLVSLMAAWVVQRWEAERRAVLLRQDVVVYAQAIQQAFQGLVADVQALAQFYDASGGVSATKFARFTRPFLERNRSLQAMEWVPRVRDGDRPRFEAEGRAEGLTEFGIRERLAGTLRPAWPRAEYFPVYRVEPLPGNTMALGFDAASEPLRRAALERARDRAEPAATAPLDLVQEIGTQRGLVIFVAHFQTDAPRDTREARQRHLVGFAVGVVRLGDLMAEVLERFPPRGLDLVLRDAALHGDASLLHVHASRVRGGGARLDLAEFMANPLAQAVRLEMAGQILELRAAPAPDSYVSSQWPLALLSLGGLVSLALAALFQHRQVSAARLREREELFRLFMDNTPTIAWIKDEHSRYVYFNATFAQRFGARLADWWGKNDFEVWPRDTATAFHSADQRVLAADQPLEFNEVTPLADGGNLHWQTYKIPFRDKGGRRYVGGIGVDVTARRQAEAKLRESEAHFRSLFEGMREGFLLGELVLDDQGAPRDWRYLDVNPAYSRIMGQARDEVVGRRARELFPDMDETWHGTPIQVVLEGQSRYLEGLFRPTGRYYEAHYYTPAPHQFACVFSDITERKQAELELRRYQQIVETSSDQLVFVDRDLRYRVVNPAYARLFLAEPEDLRGRPVREVVGTDLYQLIGPRLEAALAGEVQRFNRLTPYPDGRTRCLDAEYRPFLMDGEVQGLVVSLHDMTEAHEARTALESHRAHLEELVAARTQALKGALAEAERLARVRSEFLANMSHEIRTPLNAVLGLAQLGQRESGGRKLQETFTRILEAGQHLLGVVDDILDFSKIEAGKLLLEQGEMAPGRVIDGVLDLIAERAYAKGLELWVEEAADLPAHCHGDALRLSQVLVNLLSNAVKFTEQGRVTLSVDREGDRLTFQVADTGIGMTVEQVERLFAPFQQADGSTTRRFGGTGLGLIISKRLVDLMGGEIQVDSRPGEGSRFRVRLPLVNPGPPPLPIPGRVALVGLPEAEASVLATALTARGIRALVVPPEVDWPSVDLLLAAPQALTLNRLEATLAAGQILAVVLTPGRHELPDVLRERLPVLDRPLRARHLLTLLEGAETPRPSPVASGPRLTGMNLLAAEDNEVNRLVLEEILTSEGARLTCFENGQRLLEHLDQVGDGAYALLLTDIQMPELDGYATARRCRERYPGLPIVGLTAHALAEERERCLAAGMVEHVSKPVDIDRLVAVILRHARHAPSVAVVDVTPAISGQSAGIQAEDTPIDWAGLEARYPGKAAFIERLLVGMRRASAPIPDQLRAAADAHDLAQLTFLAHSLKGASGNLMAWGLHEQAKLTERAAREAQPETPDLARGLAAALERLLQFLEERQADAAAGPKSP